MLDNLTTELGGDSKTISFKQLIAALEGETEDAAAEAPVPSAAAMLASTLDSSAPSAESLTNKRWPSGLTTPGATAETFPHHVAVDLQQSTPRIPYMDSTPRSAAGPSASENPLFREDATAWTPPASAAAYDNPAFGETRRSGRPSELGRMTGLLSSSSEDWALEDAAADAAGALEAILL